MAAAAAERAALPVPASRAACVSPRGCLSSPQLKPCRSALAAAAQACMGRTHPGRGKLHPTAPRPHEPRGTCRCATAAAATTLAPSLALAALRSRVPAAGPWWWPPPAARVALAALRPATATPPPPPMSRRRLRARPASRPAQRLLRRSRPLRQGARRRRACGVTRKWRALAAPAHAPAGAFTHFGELSPTLVHGGPTQRRRPRPPGRHPSHPAVHTSLLPTSRSALPPHPNPAPPHPNPAPVPQAQPTAQARPRSSRTPASRLPPPAPATQRPQPHKTA